MIPTLQESAAEMIGSVIIDPPDPIDVHDDAGDGSRSSFRGFADHESKSDGPER